MLGFLYSCVAVVTFFGYVPQIIKLYHSTGPCLDLSVKTWLIWTATSLVSLSYGIIELGDFKFCLVAGINLMGCASILLLIIKNRLAHGPAPVTEAVTIGP